MARLLKGSVVRMSAKLKKKLAKSSKGHLKEFGECEGYITQYMDYHNVGDELSLEKLGPEVDVHWMSGDVNFHPRFSYMPNDLVQVKEQGKPVIMRMWAGDLIRTIYTNDKG